jgi:hypothetical protein
VLKSRRGLLAAGLAVVVVGALGVASTLNAGAEQITGAPEQVAAAAPSGPVGMATPPSVLPWGSRPARVHKGRAGASAKSLRAGGFAAASNDTTGATTPRGRYAPKGRWAKNTFLQQEQTDIAPPGPPDPSASAEPEAEQTTDPATDATTTPDEATPEQTTDDTAQATETDPAQPDATETTDAGDPGDATTAPTENAATTTTAPEPSGASSRDDVYYLYNVGSQAVEADGVYTSAYIAKPQLDKKDYHSLGELAVQSADGKQIVEIGWSVDRVVNGDDDPHLFVYHWVNKQESCYNGCGYVQYSKNVKPGDTLAPDSTKKFGIQYFNGSWWVAFDSEWIGYFPELIWNEQGVKFNRSGLIQVFGEVASSRAEPCGTFMGNGTDAVAKTSPSAYMTGIGYLNGPTDVDMYMRSTTSFYPLTILNSKTFRYGGKGILADGKSTC